MLSHECGLTGGGWLLSALLNDAAPRCCRYQPCNAPTMLIACPRHCAGVCG